MIRFIGKHFKIMTLILLLAVSCLSVNTLFADNDKNNLTFTSTNILDIDANNTLVVDLYKITTVTGDVVNAPTDGPYKDLFVGLKKAFKDMNPEELAEFANKIAGIVFGSSITRDLTVGLTTNSVDNCTMYFGIVRNSNSTSKDDYLKVDTVDETKHYSSKFFGTENGYNFQPLLFFVQGDDLTIDLSKFELMSGELTITKEYKSFVKGTKKTCVFLIEKLIDNVWKQLDYVSLTFSDAGIESTTVKNIPIGSKVRVTEVYSGSSYKVQGDSAIEVEIVKADSTATTANTASFVNDFDDDRTQGYGVLNTFKTTNKAWKYTGNDLTGGTE